MSNFQQLRVRAYLQTGVISDQFLPLDGILYYHLVRDIMGEQYISKPGESNIREGAGIMLPIMRSGKRDDTWFYHCSFAQWPINTIEDNTFYVKRFDLSLSGMVETGTRRVKINAGTYKAYHVNIYYRHAIYVEWYCIARKEELENLLRFCTHIGKKTSQGWGSVLRWEVIDWPEDWAIRGPGGRLMRAVPIHGDGFLYGIRPSYWNQRHIFPCKMPE
jgi:hypothetical protein